MPWRAREEESVALPNPGMQFLDKQLFDSLESVCLYNLWAQVRPPGPRGCYGVGCSALQNSMSGRCFEVFGLFYGPEFFWRGDFL